ncbi:hypothetical protein L210DRAFT_2648874 [Boletus edulis BED1]|uniref:ATP synthase F0 subunit 8 n=1 Tax=Boletus edulis BED1 TaxID=1328754 RepID=A0AAD4C537_BOLED|nr:hypothetical protein L210DRAFT_2648874 [Boletus edulis BED1]
MQAPWFKWIFLNWYLQCFSYMFCTSMKANQCSRNRFIANYFDGTKAFVKENWVLDYWP